MFQVMDTAMKGSLFLSTLREFRPLRKWTKRSIGGNKKSKREVKCHAGATKVLNSRRTVAIVGGGVGGLHVAARLSKEGFNVSLFEKNVEVGGRVQNVETDGGFRFDTGPSLLLFPQKYREAFQQLGENLEDHVTLKRVDPAAYRIFYGPNSDQPFADLLYDVQKMCHQLEGFEKGSGAKYLKFLSFAKEALDQGTPNFIERDFKSFLDYANLPRLLPLLRHLSPFDLLDQHWRIMTKYFSDPRLCALFTFQDLYVGLSPFNAPGAFSLLAATELIDGVWYPLGGFQKIISSLAGIARKLGVTIHTESTVTKVKITNGKVGGLYLADGRFQEADIVVANPDLPYVYSDLLPDLFQKSKKLDALEYSAGIVSFNWTLNVRSERLLHHNIFLSDEYQKSWNRATNPETLLPRPNFYVHAPSRSDPTAAPSGKDALTILLPVANELEVSASGNKPVSWPQFVDAARDRILQSFEESGVPCARESILSEFVYTPYHWKQMYNLKHGSAFGLAHGLSQLAYFRPDVAEKSVRGLYFVGASSRPGNGVPLVLMGAKLLAERILADNV